MKSRKILITLVSLFSLLLMGCGAKKDNNAGFSEKKESEIPKQTTITTEKPMSFDTLPYVEDEDDVMADQWLINNTVTEEDRSTFTETAKVFPEAEICTVIPSNTELKVETSDSKTQVSTSITEKTPITEKNGETTTVTTDTPILETTITMQETEPEPIVAGGIRELPYSIQNTVDYWKSIYPGMEIGVGIYSLDGLSGYEYNAYQTINSACSIKAAYAFYVMQTCELNGIDIWSEKIQYLPRHKDDGTSVISDYGTYYEYYTIARLVELLLGESDNTAYTMLTDRFPVSGMYQIIAPLGGQSDWMKWGRASASQRKNEWLAIYRYLNTGSSYANTLRQYLTNTNYCYLVQGMWGWHNYLHKSGWTEDSPDYPACCDAAIIDDSYLVVVMTQDYSTAIGHYDAIQGIGWAVENFYNENGGYIF